MAEKLHHYQVYIRYHTGRKSHIQAHTCTDKDKFIESKLAQCDQHNEKLTEGELRTRIEIVTKEQYDEERFAK